MKAITIWQPWASLIARRCKTIETRMHSHFACLAGQWIALHAGTQFGYDAADIIADTFERWPKEDLPRLPWDREQLERPGRFPRGCVVAVAHVAEARRLTAADTKAALCQADGLFGLVLEQIMPLTTPIGARGNQGVFEWRCDGRLMRVACPHCAAAAIWPEATLLPDGFLSGRSQATCFCGRDYFPQTEGKATPFAIRDMHLTPPTTRHERSKVMTRGMIRKKCIPSTESGTHLLTPEDPPGLYDPDTQTIRVSPAKLRRLEALGNIFARLPACLLRYSACPSLPASRGQSRRKRLVRG